MPRVRPLRRQARGVPRPAALAADDGSALRAYTPLRGPTVGGEQHYAPGRLGSTWSLAQLHAPQWMTAQLTLAKFSPLRPVRLGEGITTSLAYPALGGLSRPPAPLGDSRLRPAVARPPPRGGRARPLRAADRERPTTPHSQARHVRPPDSLADASCLLGSEDDAGVPPLCPRSPGRRAGVAYYQG